MKDRIRRQGVRLAPKGKKAGQEIVHGDKISVGNLSGSQGVAIGRGAQVTVQSGIGSKELSELFSAIYQKIETRSLDPAVEKGEITDQVKRIESEVARGEKAEPVKVERWLRNLAAMAPDIVDVTLAALTSPIAGISMAIQKIAQKVKKELS
jgi:phage-related protein